MEALKNELQLKDSAVSESDRKYQEVRLHIRFCTPSEGGLGTVRRSVGMKRYLQECTFMVSCFDSTFRFVEEFQEPNSVAGTAAPEWVFDNVPVPLHPAVATLWCLQNLLIFLTHNHIKSMATGNFAVCSVSRCVGS